MLQYYYAIGLYMKVIIHAAVLQCYIIMKVILVLYKKEKSNNNSIGWVLFITVNVNFFSRT